MASNGMSGAAARTGNLRNNNVKYGDKKKVGYDFKKTNHIG